MNITAKLKCESVLKTEYGEAVKLVAVSADSEENKSFSKYTPVANFELQINNPAALGAFVPGESYLINIAPASE